MSIIGYKYTSPASRQASAQTSTKPTTLDQVTYSEHVDRISVIVEARASYEHLRREELASCFVAANGSALHNRADKARVGSSNQLNGVGRNSLKSLPSVDRAKIGVSVNTGAVVKSLASSTNDVAAKLARTTPPSQRLTPINRITTYTPLQTPGLDSSRPVWSSQSSRSGVVAPDEQSAVAPTSLPSHNQLRIVDMVLQGTHRCQSEQRFARLTQMIAAQRVRDEIYQSANSPFRTRSNNINDNNSRPGSIGFDSMMQDPMHGEPGRNCESPIPPVPDSDKLLSTDASEDSASDDSSYDGAEGIQLYIIDRDELFNRAEVELAETLCRRDIRRQCRQVKKVWRSLKSHSQEGPLGAQHNISTTPAGQYSGDDMSQSGDISHQSDLSSRPPTTSTAVERLGQAAYTQQPISRPSTTEHPSEKERPAPRAPHHSSSITIETQTLETLRELQQRDARVASLIVVDQEETRRGHIAEEEKKQFGPEIYVEFKLPLITAFEATHRRKIEDHEASVFVQSLVDMVAYVKIGDDLLKDSYSIKEMHMASAAAPFVALRNAWRNIFAFEVSHRRNVERDEQILFRRTFCRMIQHCEITHSRFLKFIAVGKFMFESTVTMQVESQVRSLQVAAEKHIRSTTALFMKSCQPVVEYFDFTVVVLHSLGRKLNQLSAQSMTERDELMADEANQRVVLASFMQHHSGIVSSVVEASLAEKEDILNTVFLPVMNMIERHVTVVIPENKGRREVHLDEYNARNLYIAYATLLTEQHRNFQMFDKLCDMMCYETAELNEKIETMFDEESEGRNHISDEEDDYWYLEVNTVFKRLVRRDTICGLQGTARLFEGAARGAIEAECLRFFILVSDAHDVTKRINGIFHDSRKRLKHTFMHASDVLMCEVNVILPEARLRAPLEMSWQEILQTAQRHAALHHSMIIDADAEFNRLGDMKATLFHQSVIFAEARVAAEAEAVAHAQQVEMWEAAGRALLPEPLYRDNICNVEMEVFRAIYREEESCVRYSAGVHQRRIFTKFVRMPFERSLTEAEEVDGRNGVNKARTSFLVQMSAIAALNLYLNFGGIQITQANLEQEFLNTCTNLQTRLMLTMEESQRRRWMVARKIQQDHPFMSFFDLLVGWAKVKTFYESLRGRLFNDNCFEQSQITTYIKVVIVPEEVERRAIALDGTMLWFALLRYHRWNRDACRIFTDGIAEHTEEVGRDAVYQAILALIAIEERERTQMEAAARTELRLLIVYSAKVFDYMHAHDTFALAAIEHRESTAIVWKYEIAFVEKRLGRLFLDLPNIQDASRKYWEAIEVSQRLLLQQLRLYWNELDHSIVPSLAADLAMDKVATRDEYELIAKERFVVYNAESAARGAIARRDALERADFEPPMQRLMTYALQLDRASLAAFEESFGHAQESVTRMLLTLQNHPKEFRNNYFSIQENKEYPTTLDLGTYDGEKYCSDDTLSLLHTVMRSNTNLKQLSLSHLEGHISVNVALPLMTALYSKLVYIDLSHCGLADADLTSFVRTKLRDSLCTITTLLLSDNKLTPAFAKEMIANARSTVRLQSAAIDGNPDVTKSQCDILTYYCDLNKEGKSFKDIILTIESDNASLVHLDAHSRVAGGEKIKYNDTRVRLLSVAMCSNKHITSVDLSSQGITDAGAHSLARALRANAAIGNLNLSFNCITEIGCKAIEAVLDTQAYRKPLIYYIPPTPERTANAAAPASDEWDIPTLSPRADLSLNAAAAAHHAIDAGFVLGLCGNPISAQRLCLIASVAESIARTTIDVDEECATSLYAWWSMNIAASIRRYEYSDETKMQLLLRQQQSQFHEYVSSNLVPIEAILRYGVENDEKTCHKGAMHAFQTVTTFTETLLAKASENRQDWYEASEKAAGSVLEAAMKRSQEEAEAALRHAKATWEPGHTQREELRENVESRETAARRFIASEETAASEISLVARNHICTLIETAVRKSQNEKKHFYNESAFATQAEASSRVEMQRQMFAEEVLTTLSSEEADRSFIALRESKMFKSCLVPCKYYDEKMMTHFVTALKGAELYYSDSVETFLEEAQRVAGLRQEERRLRLTWAPSKSDLRALEESVASMEVENRSKIEIMEHFMFRTGIDRMTKYVNGVAGFENKAVGALQSLFDKAKTAALSQPPPASPEPSFGSNVLAISKTALSTSGNTEPEALRATSNALNGIGDVAGVMHVVSRLGSGGSVRKSTDGTPTAKLSFSPSVTPSGYHEKPRSPTHSNASSTAPADKKVMQALNHLHTQPWDLQSKGRKISENDPSVTELDLSYAGTNPEEPICTQDTIAIMFALSKNNRRLESLNLAGNKGALTARSAPLLLKLCAQTHVTTLNLSDSALGDNDIIQFLMMFLTKPECRLTAINLDKNNLSPEAIAALCKTLRENTSVTKLTIVGNSQVIPKPTLDFLTYYTGLNKYGEVFKVTVRRVESNDPTFKVVNLAGGSVVSAPNPPLIDDLGVKYLCIALSQNKVVEQVILSGNAVTDKGAKFIAFLGKSATTIKFIDLSSNDITDAGVKELLGAAQAGKQITDIRVLNNAQVTAPARRLLAAQLQQNASRMLDDAAQS